MKKSQVTIKDIAKELNISPSTVSRALRDHPDISTQTKKRVNSLAEELDYQPDSIAQSLKKRRTNLIGVIVPEIKHNFFSAAISGIEEVAYRAGYAIIVSQSNESYDRECVNVRALISNRVAGLLISISQTTEISDHFKLLERQGIPFVFFDRVCEDIEASKVVVDDFHGAFKAVEHLINSGYKRIAHIAGPKHLSISQCRLNGYLSALNKYKIQYNENYVVHGGLNEEDGIKGFQKLLKLDKLPDALFAVNDPVAIGAFEKIKEHGLKIPGDIALVGFSNNPITALIEPPLTTVSQPAYEVGKRAAKLLMEQIKSGENFIPRKEVLKTELIIRDST
ncbi:MAG: LacI family DNA-binding transcriptional regulator [Candidatus Marinimicrobia bacterium]|nr:LacI family DNA-binding transcriptional regulator [Candidatus Neomarinimicrobiota bacterium]